MAVPFCKFCLGLIVSVVVTPPLAKSLDFLFISFRAYCRFETILVSYDVTALFTIVPLDETIYILVNKTFTDDWFNKIMAFICKRTSLLNYSRLPQPINFFFFFQFNGQLYEQTDGVALGCPLGPLMANVFMCHLEEKLTRDDLMPHLYKRYVDNTLARMPSAAAAVGFLATLNSLQSSLNFYDGASSW